MTDLIRYLSSKPAPEPWATVLATVVERLHDAHDHFHWTGIYLLHGDTLVLGPFRGAPTEHVAIPVGVGICGAAASEGTTIVVDDVRTDDRYLACFVTTRSEIVVPIFRGGAAGAPVIGEIDVDSDMPAAFTPADRQHLETVARLLGALAPEDPLAGIARANDQQAGGTRTDHQQAGATRTDHQQAGITRANDQQAGATRAEHQQASATRTEAQA